jgi:hypothetical protein
MNKPSSKAGSTMTNIKLCGKYLNCRSSNDNDYFLAEILLLLLTKGSGFTR